jgi:hypothetical protein
MAKFQVSDLVKVKIEKEPYYSGYGGNPKITIPVGTIGVVGAVDVPAVTQSRYVPHPTTFNCVDFRLDDKKWRGSYYDNQIERA